MTRRNSTAAPILAALAIMLLPLGAYVGGYFWLGDYWEFNWGSVDSPPKDHWTAWRTFPSARVMNVYAPMGTIESWVRGYDVDLCCEEDMLYTLPLLQINEAVEMPVEEDDSPHSRSERVRIIVNEGPAQAAS